MVLGKLPVPVTPGRPTIRITVYTWITRSAGCYLHCNRMDLLTAQL